MSAGRCERDGCESAGRQYFRFGAVLSTGPFNSSTTGPQPDQPICLCGDHALDAFGFAFSSLPGDDR